MAEGPLSSLDASLPAAEPPAAPPAEAPPAASAQQPATSRPEPAAPLNSVSRGTSPLRAGASALLSGVRQEGGRYLLGPAGVSPTRRPAAGSLVSRRPQSPAPLPAPADVEEPEFTFALAESTRSTSPASPPFVGFSPQKSPLRESSQAQTVESELAPTAPARRYIHAAPGTQEEAVPGWVPRDARMPGGHDGPEEEAPEESSWYRWWVKARLC